MIDIDSIINNCYNYLSRFSHLIPSSRNIEHLEVVLEIGKSIITRSLFEFLLFFYFFLKFTQSSSYFFYLISTTSITLSVLIVFKSIGVIFFIEIGRSNIVISMVRRYIEINNFLVLFNSHIPLSIREIIISNIKITLNGLIDIGYIFDTFIVGILELDSF